MAVQHDGTAADPRKANGQRDTKNVIRRLGSIRAKSQTNGDDSNQVFYTDCTWRDQCGENSDKRQTSSGKILGQLRQLQESHLAYSEAHQKQIEDLEQQVIELLEEETVE
jgi:hypothetical protein